MPYFCWFNEEIPIAYLISDSQQKIVLPAQHLFKEISDKQYKKLQILYPYREIKINNRIEYNSREDCFMEYYYKYYQYFVRILITQCQVKWSYESATNLQICVKNMDESYFTQDRNHFLQQGSKNLVNSLQKMNGMLFPFLGFEHKENKIVCFGKHRLWSLQTYYNEHSLHNNWLCLYFDEILNPFLPNFHQGDPEGFLLNTDQILDYSVDIPVIDDIRSHTISFISIKDRYLIYKIFFMMSDMLGGYISYTTERLDSTIPHDWITNPESLYSNVLKNKYLRLQNILSFDSYTDAFKEGYGLYLSLLKDVILHHDFTYEWSSLSELKSQTYFSEAEAKKIKNNQFLTDGYQTLTEHILENGMYFPFAGSNKHCITSGRHRLSALQAIDDIIDKKFLFIQYPERHTKNMLYKSKEEYYPPANKKRALYPVYRFDYHQKKIYMYTTKSVDVYIYGFRTLAEDLAAVAKQCSDAVAPSLIINNENELRRFLFNDTSKSSSN